jgi:hypothetical protein
VLLSEICGLVSVGRPVWREDGSAICNVITQWSESRRTRNHTLLSHLRLPQPGGPGSRIYIPQEQGGPVIPLGTVLSESRVRVTLWLTVSQSVSQSVSQYVLASSPLCEHLTRYCFLFKCLGLEFVVLSLWGAHSDEMPCLSFVSHNLFIFLCVHLLFTFLSFTSLPYIYIYTLYNTCNTYKASFSPGSV